MADDRLRVLLQPLPAARKRVVGERRVGPDEDVVLEHDAVPELHAGLDRHAVADPGAALDEDAVADVAVGADARAGQDMGERPDPRPATDLVGLADTLLVYENVIHRLPLGGNSTTSRTIAPGRPFTVS